VSGLNFALNILIICCFTLTDQVKYIAAVYNLCFLEFWYRFAGSLLEV